MCGFARSQSPQALFDLMQLITGPQPQQLEPVQCGVVKSAVHMAESATHYAEVSNEVLSRYRYRFSGIGNGSVNAIQPY